MRPLCARRELSEANVLKLVEEMMKATAFSHHFVSLSVRLWSKFLPLIMEKLRFLNICFYLHPKSTLDKRKNDKYFLNSSCQSFPYFLSLEPMKASLWISTENTLTGVLHWDINDAPPSQLPLGLPGISKCGRRGKTFN